MAVCILSRDLSSHSVSEPLEREGKRSVGVFSENGGEGRTTGADVTWLSKTLAFLTLQRISRASDFSGLLRRVSRCQRAQERVGGQKQKQRAKTRKERSISNIRLKGKKKWPEGACFTRERQKGLNCPLSSPVCYGIMKCMCLKKANNIVGPVMWR